MRWKRNLSETFSSDESLNENKDIRQVIALDTPSTSTHTIEDIDIDTSNSSKIDSVSLQAEGRSVDNTMENTFF